MDAIDRQIAEVMRVFPALEKAGRLTLRGLLPFSASLEGENVQDVFNLEIVASQDFYKVAPTVRDLGGRTAAYTHVNPDGTFCLGAPQAVQMAYRESGTLLAFIKEQVIPYLFTFCIWERKGQFPYGELQHGGAGILQYYREDYFKVTTDIQVLRLLKVNIERSHKQVSLCPCDSGKYFKACHGRMVQAISRSQTYAQLLADYDTALRAYVKYGSEIP